MALAAIEDYGARILSLRSGAGSVLRAAAAHPDVPLLQSYAASAWLFAQTSAGDRSAAPFLARAAELAPGAHPREERWRAAMDAWHRHAFLEAASILESLTGDWPGDLVAAKVCEFLYYVLGQQHEGERFRRHMERLARRHGDDPDFLAMLAFACELTGDVVPAEAAARRALEVRSETPWADHALAHVWLRRGDVDAARAHLAAALPIWERHSPVILAHNAWHLALAHLEALDLAAADALLERSILGGDREDVSAALDAIALLWRVEMIGGERSARWDALADRVEPLVDVCFMPFHAAHVAYALARAGRGSALDALLAGVAEVAERGDADARRAWSRVGRALVVATAAFAGGDPMHAASLLEPVFTEVSVGGGSDAQCDLFRLTHVHALAASGRRAEATRVLEVVLGARRRSALDRRWGEIAAGAARALA